MKKLLLLLFMFMSVVFTHGQTTTFKTDLVLDKTGTAADRIYLRGNGSILDFMTGDLVLTHSSNLLTLSGGNLSLGANSLLLTGSIGATGARVTKGWMTDLEITNLPTIAGTSLSTYFVPTTRTVNGKALSSNIIITASDVSLGNVANESKVTMFASPTFTGTVTMPTSWRIGTTLITATASEINRLHGVLATTTEINGLIGVSGSIQQQLDGKLSSTNNHLTGLTIIDQLQIGESDSAIVIEGLTDVGTGLTVTKDGQPITYNFPSENIISITDIPVVPTIYSAAGDTSNQSAPGKIGNIYINTTSGLVYISVSVSSGGWRRLN